jgi:hypothetical protein
VNKDYPSQCALEQGITRIPMTILNLAAEDDVNAGPCHLGEVAKSPTGIASRNNPHSISRDCRGCAFSGSRLWTPSGRQFSSIRGSERQKFTSFIRSSHRKPEANAVLEESRGTPYDTHSAHCWMKRVRR